MANKFWNSTDNKTLQKMILFNGIYNTHVDAKFLINQLDAIQLNTSNLEKHNIEENQHLRYELQTARRTLDGVAPLDITAFDTGYTSSIQLHANLLPKGITKQNFQNQLAQYRGALKDSAFEAVSVSPEAVFASMIARDIGRAMGEDYFRTAFHVLRTGNQVCDDVLATATGRVYNNVIRDLTASTDKPNIELFEQFLNTIPDSNEYTTILMGHQAAVSLISEQIAASKTATFNRWNLQFYDMNTSPILGRQVIKTTHPLIDKSLETVTVSGTHYDTYDIYLLKPRAIEVTPSQLNYQNFNIYSETVPVQNMFMSAGGEYSHKLSFPFQWKKAGTGPVDTDAELKKKANYDFKDNQATPVPMDIRECKVLRIRFRAATTKASAVTYFTT